MTGLLRLSLGEGIDMGGSGSWVPTHFPSGNPMSHHRFASPARQRSPRGWTISRLLMPALLGIACESPFGGDCIAIGVP
jgi:hypothetical protein